MSDETTETPCAACGEVLTGPSPVTRTVTARSAGVSGSRAQGPWCPACDDELSHLNYLFFSSGELGFCGCGCPDDAYALVRGILGLAPFFENGESGTSNGQKVRDLLGGSEGAFYLVLYALDRVDLLEHGTSIGRSWLTAKGAHYLALMRKHEWDAVASTGYPHYDPDNPDEDCGPGCPQWEASTEDYLKDEIRRATAEVKRAGDWQVLQPNVWRKLDDADAMVLTKSKVWIKSRSGTLSSGKD